MFSVFVFMCMCVCMRALLFYSVELNVFSVFVYVCMCVWVGALLYCFMCMCLSTCYYLYLHHSI